MFSSPELNLNQANFTPGMTVVDLGSGIGSYSLAAAALVGSHGKVIAVDVHKDALGRLRTEAEVAGFANVSTVWADLESPHGSRLADGIADRVIVANVLFLSSDRPAIIREAARVCKRGGFILIVDWTHSHGGIGPTAEMVVSRSEIVELAEANELELSKEIKAGEYHYGLLFKRP
jgi:ubiquinone/menaquinone biosynthesis C-methylase UbiE